MDRTVTLVLTHQFDPTADYVVEELNRRGAPVFRCDPGEFPSRLTLRALLADSATWEGRLRLPEREVAFAEIGCAYYRRPTAFRLPEGMGEQVRRWAAAEARMGLGGVLSALPRWLNHPADIARAEYKPVQLAHARAAGLPVPATLVTNDPREVSGFLARVGKAVYKPLTPVSFTSADHHRALFTTPVAGIDVDESVKFTAHLIQAWVDKAYEVRLTVVDNAFFAARIDAQSEASVVDWRTDYDALSYRPLTAIPPLVRAGVGEMMTRLRLRFGTLDFVVSPDETWWFLEINPNGQWAWIEDATGLPIASSIADALMREDL